MATSTCNILLIGKNVDKFKLYLSSYKYNLVKTIEKIVINDVEIVTFTMYINLQSFVINFVMFESNFTKEEVDKIMLVVDSIIVLDEFKPIWLNTCNKLVLVKQYGSLDDILQCIYNKICTKTMGLGIYMSDMDKLADCMSRLYI